MTEKEYLEERVENQIKWYSSKSRDIKKKYFTTQVIEIIISALISGCAQFTIDNKIIGNIITFLGIILVIFSAIRNLFKWQDLWIKYRSTSEMLKREKFLFMEFIKMKMKPSILL